MTLTYDDLQSPLCKKIREHLESEVDRLRKENDKLSKDQDATNFLRGRIDAHKVLLVLLTYQPLAQEE